MASDIKCVSCGSPVVVDVCTSEYIEKNPAAELWDYWIRCTNDECENQIGEGHFQHYPDWVKIEELQTRRGYDEILSHE